MDLCTTEAAIGVDREVHETAEEGGGEAPFEVTAAEVAANGHRLDAGHYAKKRKGQAEKAETEDAMEGDVLMKFPFAKKRKNGEENNGA